jgi:hypothetical protein
MSLPSPRLFALALVAVLAVLSATIGRPTQAKAGELEFSLSVGDRDDRYRHDGYRDDGDWVPSHRYRHSRKHRPKYLYPRSYAPRVYGYRDRYDTVCKLVPVRVWTGYRYVIRDRKSCWRVERW